MKVALLISGYLRNYEENIDFIKNEIINKYINVDVYLHITKDERSEDRYLNQIEDSDIERITSVLKPFSTIIENNTHYHEDKRINNVINHWNKLYKLNDLKKINEVATNTRYDLVIRCRPDLSIKTENIFDMVEEGFISIPKDSKIDKVRLTNPNDGYVCDAIAFGNSVMMDKYFDLYQDLNELIEKYGPVSETILYQYLKLNDIQYKLIDIDYSFVLSKCNVFAICGDSGSGKSTLSNLLKNAFTDSFKLECDRYHKWERTNEIWGEITHLNPKANYITKMKEDIFNLKLGNDIYQVDYDHHTGSFTEKQLINPSNNLIVCGLHSLYATVYDNEMYDLKIYMDTDSDLKKKWKITRDVKERGYSIDKVLDSIKKRESDFESYIAPQRDLADLIIRFFTTDKLDFNDLDQDPKLSLSLSISNKFNINDLLLMINHEDIKFSTKIQDNFTEITFMEYKESNILTTEKEFTTGTFYDYILFFILNLGFTS